METMSKADRFINSMTTASDLDKKWLFGNETDDPLRYAFNAKRVIHPGVKGKPVPKEEIPDLWDRLMKQTGERTKRAAYIHIPFCQTRCLYCGFFQNFSNKEMEDAYIDALINELRMTREAQFIKAHPFHAVYFGGGTPSAFSAQNIQRLLREIRESLPLANDYEMTFESRFHGFDDEKVKACLDGGVNRFSFGVQSFNTKVRQSIGRIDSGEYVFSRLRRLMSLDNSAVVIDLMYGLPHQTMEVWEQDVKTLIDCGIDGGDLYQLNVYEDSRLKQAIEKGTLPPAAKISEQALMFKRGVEIMQEKRFQRLSVCHWRNSTRERNIYNSLSKSGAVTIPFGSGAGGKIEGYTMFVERDIKTYIARINNKEKPIMFMMSPPEDYMLYSDIIGQMDRGQLNFFGIKTAYGIDLKEVMEPLFTEWQRKGLIEINGDYLDLTIAGQFWYVNLTQAILDWLVMIKNERSHELMVKAIAAQG